MIAEIANAAAQYGLPALAIGISAWFGLKGIRAQAKSQSEGQVAAEKIKAQTATEERLQVMLDTQHKTFIVPLQEKVDKQGIEIESLKESIKKEQDQKWDAISYIRALLAWIGVNISPTMSPLPNAPESIRHHVNGWHFGQASPNPDYRDDTPEEES